MSEENGLSRGLEGLRVLVTAGGSGIGHAIARRLVAEGARVHICDVVQSLLDDFAAQFPGQGWTHADVSRDEDVDRLFEAAHAHLGGLDALINNAGIAGPTAAVEAIDPADWRRCLEVCLTGQFLCARRAVPMLRASGGGAIVNMSSAAGRFGYAYRTPYSAAKWGVIGLTESLAKELGPSNIRVNAILPGLVAGPRIESVISNRAEEIGISYDEMETRYLANTSLRRMVTADDVAGTVLFLLSEAGHNVSGQSIGVDASLETI